MFKITYKNLILGLVVVEDREFGLIFHYVESNCLSVSIENDYDLIFKKNDGTIKKIQILSE